MLGKVWKKVLFFILITACVFNVMFKLIKRTSLKDEIESTIKYIKDNKVVENVVSNEEDKRTQEVSKPIMVIETE